MASLAIVSGERLRGNLSELSAGRGNELEFTILAELAVEDEEVLAFLLEVPFPLRDDFFAGLMGMSQESKEV